MKGSPLIIFFVLLFFPLCQGADVTNDTFEFSGSSSNEVTFNQDTSLITSGGICKVRINNIESLQGLNSIVWNASTDKLYNANEHNEYDTTCVFTIDGDVVGTGIFGYSKNADESRVFIQLHTWEGELDIGTKTGTKYLLITQNTVNDLYFKYHASTAYSSILTPPSGASDLAYFCYTDTSEVAAGGETASCTVSVQSDYSQSIPFNYTSSDNFNMMFMDRDASKQSKVEIKIGGEVAYTESTLQSEDLEWVDISKDNYTWIVDLENLYGDSLQKTLVFSYDPPVTSGVLEFNKSYFTSPDVVGVKYDIENIDLVNDEYWILLTGTNDGIKYFVTNDYYDITTATGQDNFTISNTPLTLPFTMQAELWRYSRVSGKSSLLSYSPQVEYNPSSQAPGSIWTDKDNYNLSEVFYIQFDTNYNSVQIELISSDFYDLRTMEGPGLGHLGYLFNDPHNFTAYLIEDGIKTNYTEFTVSADSPFLNIHVDNVPVNQGFCFSYYTDNTSDTITGYRPDGSIFYGPTTNLITLEKVDVCGPSSSSPAGIYTMSLLHDGVDYYNDTIVMSSANEYIYFESSKYETGDRIIIHYYIMDRQQRIRLSDSLGIAVITWTCDAFYITPNMGNSLWFSLIDNNEYGLNMNASIDAGTFRTGNWKVEIIGIDGKPLTDYDTYDYTTVNKKIDTPEDQTTEFILLIFSPEGIFLILTSVLMLAGLVAAKHPAGGAAGAAVGVGFGVFFGVLPVWMLLLMVILLVVLAGVGTAVYFKGK